MTSVNRVLTTPEFYTAAHCYSGRVAVAAAVEIVAVASAAVITAAARPAVASVVGVGVAAAGTAALALAGLERLPVAAYNNNLHSVLELGCKAPPLKYR